MVNVNPAPPRPPSDAPEIRKYKKRFGSEILCAALWGQRGSGVMGWGEVFGGVGVRVGRSSRVPAGSGGLHGGGPGSWSPPDGTVPMRDPQV